MWETDRCRRERQVGTKTQMSREKKTREEIYLDSETAGCIGKTDAGKRREGRRENKYIEKKTDSL